MLFGGGLVIRSVLRRFSSTPRLSHGEYERRPPESEKDIVSVTFIDKTGIIIANINLNSSAKDLVEE
jgi:hypothetical protein